MTLPQLARSVFGCVAGILLATTALADAPVIRFPADAGVLNVKTHFGAAGDGVTDDTAALQSALTAATGIGRPPLYFPAGTYRVRGSLVIPSNALSVTIFGEHRDTTVIRLDDNLLSFAAGSRLPLLNLFNVSAGWTNDAFMTNVINLTLDTGSGNPGAVAIRYAANNQGTLRHVTIRSGDGSGWCGIDVTHDSPGPALVKDVSVSGFDYALRLGLVQYSLTLEDVTISGQNIAGLWNNGNVLTVRRLVSNQSSGSVPAVTNPGADGLLTLLNARLAHTGSPTSAAVVNQGRLFVRDVVATGYVTALSHQGNAIPGLAIAEYASEPHLALHASPSASLMLPVEETPEPGWDDPSTWINAALYGAFVGDGVFDHTALQAAIDACTPTNRTVYLPNAGTGQSYQLGGTVILRGHCRRIVGMNNPLILGSAFAATSSPVFLVPATGAPDLVALEWLYTPFHNPAKTTTWIANASASTVVLRNLFLVYGKAYDGAASTGKTFIEDVHSFNSALPDPNIPAWTFGPDELTWARQFNPENYGGQTANLGGRLWILGYKTEKYGPQLDNRPGAFTEILGALIHPQGTGVDASLPVFVNDSGSVSIVALEPPSNTISHTLIVRETRDASTADLVFDSTSPWAVGTGSNRSFLLGSYTGYKPAPAQSLPWSEIFDQAYGDNFDRGATAWELDPTGLDFNGSFAVNSGALEALHTGAPVSWFSAPIPVSGETHVTLTATYSAVGALTAADRIDIGYSADGAAPVWVHTQTGAPASSPVSIAPVVTLDLGVASLELVVRFTSTAPGSGHRLDSIGLASAPPPSSEPVLLAAYNGPATAGDWIADATIVSGTSLGTGSTASAIDLSGVTDPAPEAVYQTHRHGKPFAYTLVGLEPGAAHTVRLHFCETWADAPNRRRFHVDINGTRVLTNLDVLETTGGKNRAHAETFTANADANGIITIDFLTGSKNRPFVSGIELWR